MTEFLKNNPIAVRHCLLYEFLHGKSIGKSFKAFRTTVGYDFMVKEAFSNCFMQFRRGIFNMDDGNKPITDMRDILRSDKYAIRTCILYESLRCHRIKKIINFPRHLSFGMYKNFCNVIGEEIMKYTEFDFWFYRFINGEYELDFERDEDKKVHELMDMPMDVMKHIVQYLDIIDRMVLMKTSRSLRLFIPQHKLFHHTLILDVYDKFPRISFGGLSNIKYAQDQIYCARKFKESEQLIKYVSPWKQAVSDFSQILNHPKLHLHTLDIDFSRHNPFLLEFLFPPSVNSTQLLYVKELFLNTCSLKQLLNILPALKPGYLTTIDISSYARNDDDVMQKVIEMEQWKQAKCFKMNYSFSVAPRLLYHFKEFEVRFREFSAEDVRQMKEILFKSIDFEKCKIGMHGSPNMAAIRHEFGDAIPGSTSIFKYSIPNSTEYFEIKIGDWEIEITREKI